MRIVIRWRVRTGLIGAAATLLAACAAPAGGPGPAPGRPPAVVPAPEPVSAARPATPVPARLVAGSPARCLAEIEAFAEQHSGNRVMLGDAAFAGSDQLVLTRAPRRAPDGTLLDGRASPPRPLVLSLLVGPDGCLIRVTEGGTGGAAEGALPACRCTPTGR